jgi:TolB protein
MKKNLYLLITIFLCSLLWMASCRDGSPLSSPAMTTSVSTLSIKETVEPTGNMTNDIQPSPTWPITTPTLTRTPFLSQTPDDLNVIAFTGTGEDRENQEIYLVNENSLRLVNLTQNPAADFMPAWSPDGSQIAFISSRNNESMQIYIMSADGSEVKQITDTDLIPLHKPSWSPDGKRIVFDAKNQDGFGSISIVDLNSFEITSLVDEASDNLVPNWSPDGKQIAFISNRDGSNEGDFHIYLLDILTNEIHRLTDDIASDTSPEWSPDGKYIAFSRDTSARAPYICIMSPDGLNLKELLSGNREIGGDFPSWSGDGRMIAFQDLRPIDSGLILEWLNSVYIYSIFIMNSDGSGTERLTFGNIFAQYPDWRP